MSKRSKPENNDDVDSNAMEFDDNVDDGDNTMFDPKRLSALKETDPDFYEFLCKNEPEMVGAKEEVQDDEEMGWDLGDDIEAGDVIAIKKLIASAKEGDDVAQLHSVKLFVDAVKEKQIESASDYEAIMNFAVTEMPTLFSKKKGLFKIYMRGVVLALKNISDNNISKVFISIIDSNAQKFAIGEEYSKTINVLCQHVFAVHDDLHEISTTTLLNVFKYVKSDPARIEKGLRYILGGYMKMCKQYSRWNVELFEEVQTIIKKITAYNSKATANIMFDFIKQMGLVLRSVTTTNSLKTVCSFGFIKTLEIIGVVLKSNTDNKIQQLIHPFCQISNSVLDVVVGNTHLPVILDVSRIVIDLASPRVFVNPIPALLNALQGLSVVVLKPQDKKKGSKSKREKVDYDITYSLQIEKSDLKNVDFIGMVINSLLESIEKYFNIYKSSIAFPELAGLALITLKKMTKESKLVVFNNKVNAYVKKLQKSVDVLKQKRSMIDFGPFDVTKVSEFENN
ncbi:Nucleolar complex protein 2-like protein [Entamoeba marina]